MKWRISAWVEDPGDFPGRQFKVIDVHEMTMQKAITKAENSLFFQISPVIVKAERISPPITEKNA